MKFINYFKEFFYPSTRTYFYDKPVQLIDRKIHSILEESQYTPFWAINNDFKGSFEDAETFYIKTISRGYMRNQIQYSVKLIAKIAEVSKDKTSVETKAMTSIEYYFIFFPGIIIGTISCINFFRTGIKADLYWSIGIALGGIILSFCLSNPAKVSIYEIYEWHIDGNLTSV